MNDNKQQQSSSNNKNPVRQRERERKKINRFKLYVCHATIHKWMEHIPIAELYCFRYCCSLFFFSRFFSEHFLFLRLLSLVAVGNLMCGEGRTDRSKQAAAREKNNQKSQPQNMRNNEPSGLCPCPVWLNATQSPGGTNSTEQKKKHESQLWIS